MADSTQCIFQGLQILIENKWVKDHAVLIEENVIKAVLPLELISHSSKIKIYNFPNDYYLIPGLIDLHIHGVNGFDVMDGSVSGLLSMSHALAKEGVTGFLATTMTATRDRMDLVLSAIAEAMFSKNVSAILGIHLEGPFISQEKMGAQLGDAIEQPDINLIKHWQKLANGAIKLVTLAPELPNAKSLIQILKEMNVVISAGHTNATYAEVCDAIELGCSHATHLFNAMSGLHHREPGAALALLLAKNVSTELIVDGLHVHPAMVDLTLRIKGNEKFVLVTDAIRAKCLGDGEYELGGQTVTVNANKASLKSGVLAGSMLSMPDAIKNTVKFTGCSLADAVNMASDNPARILNLTSRKGSIANGKDADLVVMNSSFNVVMTMREGKIVYE